VFVLIIIAIVMLRDYGLYWVIFMTALTTLDFPVILNGQLISVRITRFLGCKAVEWVRPTLLPTLPSVCDLVFTDKFRVAHCVQHGVDDNIKSYVMLKLD
jgi:hypothetical protein